MKRILLIVLLVSVGLNIGLAVSLHRSRGDARPLDPWQGRGAGPGLHDPGETRPGPEGRPGRPSLERLHGMRERIRPELREHRQSVHAARESLRAALSREDVDEAEIMELVGAMVAAQGRIDSLVAVNMVQTLRELTPEERREVLDHMPWRRYGRGGRGRGGGPGSP
jgi:Spy/CpxP family protein refolding chaperone